MFICFHCKLLCWTTNMSSNQCLTQLCLKKTNSMFYPTKDMNKNKLSRDNFSLKYSIEAYKAIPIIFLDGEKSERFWFWINLLTREYLLWMSAYSTVNKNKKELAEERSKFTSGKLEKRHLLEEIWFSHTSNIQLTKVWHMIMKCKL